MLCFLFDPTPGINFDTKFKRFEREGRKTPYRFSLQAGLWRRECLIKYLRNHEGPWQFESWGSIRSRRYKEKFYSLKPGVKRVFFYPGGGVLCSCKWNGKDNCDLIKKYFDVDFSKRGIYYEGDKKDWSIGKRSFLEKAFGVLKSLI